MECRHRAVRSETGQNMLLGNLLETLDEFGLWFRRRKLRIA